MNTHEMMGISRPDPLAEAKLYNAVRPTVTLLVEGELDARFWRMWCVARVWSCGGRQQVLDQLDRAHQDDEVEFLAVLDADFDRIEGRLLARADVVWTDAHDLETTLLGLPVLEKLLLSELASDSLAVAEGRWGESFRTRLMRHAETLGRLRWLNAREHDGLGLCFSKPGRRGGDYTRFDKYDCCVAGDWMPCLQSGLKAIINYSNAQRLLGKDLAGACALLPTVAADQVCNGHDLLGFLKLGVETIHGSRQSAMRRSIGDWGRALVIACERRWVQTTQMWRTLAAWDVAHSKYRLMRSDT